MFLNNSSHYKFYFDKFFKNCLSLTTLAAAGPKAQKSTLQGKILPSKIKFWKNKIYYDKFAATAVRLFKPAKNHF